MVPSQAFPPSPDLHERSPEHLRASIRHYFITTFDLYASLFETLVGVESYLEKPIPLRHPLIFYLGHTATFFVNKLMLTRLIDERLDPHLESIFAVGVDEMSWDDLDTAQDGWPELERVWAYRAKVRELVLRLIDETPLEGPIGWESPWWAIIMGIEHELIHLETSSVLIRQHRLDRVKPHPLWQPNVVDRVAPENALVQVVVGQVVWGRERESPIYGWDNEYGRHEAEVPAFEAGRSLVSNGEFLAFVEAGGYAERQYWDDEGWEWRAFAQAEAPSFWVKGAAGWRLRLMTEEVPMPWSWPVEVNHLEAKAFCAWKSAQEGRRYRLPSEDEWARMLDESGVEAEPGSPVRGNHRLAFGASPMPVDHFGQGAFYDLIGNVWEWTETPIYPFEGFQVHPIYDDFTTPTFDDKHYLMKGGSWISCGNEAHRHSRYAFRRHFFQHAGFRYVVAEHEAKRPPSRYESDKMLSEYAEFHYGDRYFGVENFPKALVDQVMPYLDGVGRGQALDLGCASGRATFELARHFEQVTGVDFSARFIGQGVSLAQGESLRYVIADEGELVSYRARSLRELGLAEVASKVTFWQGDACNLKPDLTGYDFIFAANLIDRLYEPRLFLEEIHRRLKVGGVLMIASPYTWLEEHTPREAWIGGFKRDGETVTTLDGLKEILGAHFERMAEPFEVPFVIRETKRKFQHSLSEVSLWRRRG